MTTPNTIKRYAVDDCQQAYCCAPASVCEDSDGEWVRYADHLAALSRARDEARREALEEAKRRIQAIKGRPSAYEVECFGASSRKGGTWIERYVAVAAIDEALLTPTPQGETKEQQP